MLMQHNFMKSSYISRNKKHRARKVLFFRSFTNPFNPWPVGRKLGCHACSALSCAMSHVVQPWGIPGHTRETEGVRKANDLLVL